MHVAEGRALPREPAAQEGHQRRSRPAARCEPRGRDVGRGDPAEGEACERPRQLHLANDAASFEAVAASAQRHVADPPRAVCVRGDIRRIGRCQGRGRGRAVAKKIGCYRIEIGRRQVSRAQLIVAMLDGIGAENFPHRQSMQAMPGFADKLSDAQAAALANYLRVTWGGQKGDVTADAVRALR